MYLCTSYSFTIMLCVHLEIQPLITLITVRYLSCALISVLLAMMLFFFSSRRRHTRCLSDWSSDVCSSDLEARGKRATRKVVVARRRSEPCDFSPKRQGSKPRGPHAALRAARTDEFYGYSPSNRSNRLEIRCQKQKIGRASCRERG